MRGKPPIYIGFVFGLAALAVLIVGSFNEAQADPPPIKPIAICDKSSCTMTRADYDKLVEFHQKVYAAILEWEQREQSYQEVISEMSQYIKRNIQNCFARRT